MTQMALHKRLISVSAHDLLWLINALNDNERKILFKSSLAPWIRKKLHLPTPTAKTPIEHEPDAPPLYRLVIQAHRSNVTVDGLAHLKPAVRDLLVAHWESNHG